MKKIGLVSVFSLLILIACDEDDALNKTVLERIVFHENVDQIGTYEYNSNGSLEKYRYTFDGKLTEYTDYDYTGAKLSSKTTYLSSDGAVFNESKIDMFEYDSEGRVSRINYDKDGLNEAVYDFTWQGGQVAKIERTVDLFGEITRTFYEFEYDNKGNVSNAAYYVNNGEVPELNYIVEYEYDDKINPLAELSDPWQVEFRGPNNMTKSTQRLTAGADPFSVTTFEYTYNEQDLPTMVTKVYNIDGQISSVINKYHYRKM